MNTYAVGSNMPGYMPDETPYSIECLNHAKECMLEDITHYLEDINLDSRYSTEQVKEYCDTMAQVDNAPAQECNVYLGDRVFFITSE